MRASPMKNYIIFTLGILVVLLGPESVDARQIDSKTDAKNKDSESSNVVDRQRPILHFDLLGEGRQIRPGTIARKRDGSIAKELKHVTGAVWSSNGESFAYYSQPQPDKPQTLKLETLAGKSRTLFTAPDKQLFVWHPCWSPDGKRIAAVVAREATKNVSFDHQTDFSLKIINTEKGGVEKSIEIPIGVLEFPYPTTPSNSFSWSPDGKHILVSWASSVVITVDTGRHVIITKGYSIAEWAPNSRSVYFFDFKPEYEGAPEGLYAVKGFFQRSLSQDSAKLLKNDVKLAELNIFDHPGIFYMRLTLSPKGKKMAMVVGAGKEKNQRKGCLLVYEMTNIENIDLGKPARRIEIDKQRVIDHISFSPDEEEIGCLVMTNRDKYTIETLDLKTGKWKKLGDLTFNIGNYGIAALDFIGWHKALSWTN